MILNKTIIGIVRCYQMVISPLFPKSCRYSVSCSQNTINNMKYFGFVLGFFWSVSRILRCNPWSVNNVENY